MSNQWPSSCWKWRKLSVQRISGRSFFPKSHRKNWQGYDCSISKLRNNEKCKNSYSGLNFHPNKLEIQNFWEIIVKSSKKFVRSRFIDVFNRTILCVMFDGKKQKVRLLTAIYSFFFQDFSKLWLENHC